MSVRTQVSPGRPAVRPSDAHSSVADQIRLMTGPQQTMPVQTPEIEDVPEVDRPWVTVVWNDPVNLMSYVTWVFQKLFGYSKDKAEQLMLDVHHKGKAVVSSGARERMEFDASRLHEHGLWATVTRE